MLDAAVLEHLNKEIAANLDIVDKTVKVHRARAFWELVTMVVRHRDGIDGGH